MSMSSKKPAAALATAGLWKRTPMNLNDAVSASDEEMRTRHAMKKYLGPSSERPILQAYAQSWSTFPRNAGASQSISDVIAAGHFNSPKTIA